MKTIFRIILLLSITANLLACSGKLQESKDTPAENTPTLPPPQISVTRSPDASNTASEYFQYWQDQEYEKMYNLLSMASQQSINLEDFSLTYQETSKNLTLQNINVEINNTQTNPGQALVNYHVNYQTKYAQDLQRDITMSLTLENGNWKILWDKSLILPELAGGNKLALDITVPDRGNIYDRYGELIAAQSDAYAIGVKTGEIYSEGQLLKYLSTLIGKSEDEISYMYSGYGPGWYIPIGSASADEVNRYLIQDFSGLVLQPFSARFYFENGVAPQTIGYVQPIPAEQLDEYIRNGYRSDELVGTAGLEKWSNDDLSGERGVDMYVVNPDGQVVNRLAHTTPAPAYSIYTTLDNNLQTQAQRALYGFKGAIVVLERDSGRVLAMVSSPGFDPNIFAPTNPNGSVFLEELINNEDKPLLNRATQGGYPLGSANKIITMAAALESGLYTKDTVYNCGHEFRELPDLVLYDWTYEKEYPPSGELTLPEGLMRSCNPYFWHIGLDLYRQNMPTAVSDMARAFGLGEATGIGQVAEDTGSFPDPENEGDAVQLAIGQGTMLATPLQAAAFTAAIGNGGTLYRPQIIEQIVDADGNSTFEFKPEVNGYLPIKPENLEIIQEAMNSVIANERGTAHTQFIGIKYPVFGKTGTAQNPFGRSHAWFVGYTNRQSTKTPDIAVAVIAENAGEGSEVGAPIFRRIIEIYFSGKPIVLYPWEKWMYVPFTPTPLYPPTYTPVPSTRTPEPEQSETPES